MANYWFNDIQNAKADIIQSQQQYTRMIQDTPPAWTTLQKVPFRVLMKALIKQKDIWDQELGILQKKADHLQYSDPANTKLRDAIQTFKADQTNFQVYSQMEDQIIEIEEYLTMKDSDQHSYNKNITKQNYRTKQESAATKIPEQEGTIEHHTAANIQSEIELQFVSSQVNDYPILQQDDITEHEYATNIQSTKQDDITEQEFATVLQSAIERLAVNNEQRDYPIIQQQHYIQQSTTTYLPTDELQSSQPFISTQVSNIAVHQEKYANVSNLIALCSNLDGRALEEIMKNAMKQSLGRKFLNFNEFSTIMCGTETTYDIHPITNLYAKEPTAIRHTDFILPSTESTPATPTSDFYTNDPSYMLSNAAVGERIVQRRYYKNDEHLNTLWKLWSTYYFNFLCGAKQSLPIADGTSLLYEPDQNRGKWRKARISNFIKCSDDNSTDIHNVDGFTTRRAICHTYPIKQTSSSCWWPECHDDSSSS